MQVIDHVKPRFNPCSLSYHINTVNHFSYFRDTPIRVNSFEELRERTELIYSYDKAWQKVAVHIRTLEALLHTEVYFSMPRNNSNSLVNWQFANINLTQADEDKFTNWYASKIQDLVQILSEILYEGYKLSVTYDTDNVCFITTLSGTVNSPLNKGVSMSARSDDFYECLGLLLYKHLVICESGEWLKHTRRSNWG